MGVATVNTPHGPRKLGRIRPKARPQCLPFKWYYDPKKDVSPPPAAVDYSGKAVAALSRMYLNDSEGDCVIAGKYHEIGVWTGNESGTPIQASDAEVQASYQTICGPGDNGCVITDVLDWFKSKGLTAGGKQYKISGYVSVDFTNKTEVMVALDLFGALTIGINLPNDWTNAGPGVVWGMTNSQIVGGHDVTLYGYNSQGVLVSTWGQIGTVLTWEALAANGQWVEEMYAILSPDWTANANLAPNGVDAASLAADLADIGGGTIPPLPGPPAPPSPPTPPVVPPVVPPAPPAPAQDLVAQVAPVQISLTEPGLFGRTLTGTVPGQSAPVVPAASAAEDCDRPFEVFRSRKQTAASPTPAIIVTEVLDLLIAFLPYFGVPVPSSLAGILAVIEQGLESGMTLSQIIAAVIASLVPMPTPAQQAFLAQLRK